MAAIVVAGYAVRHPVPGNMYAFLHYVIGLHRMGHTVTYVEESGWDESCYDPGTNAYSDDPSVGLALVSGLLAAAGVEGVPLIFVDRASGRSWGDRAQQLGGALQEADLLLNVGGVCWLPEFLEAPRRALVDLDPLFTQAGVFAGEGRDTYDAYFTYGTAINTPGCLVPGDGIAWKPTVPPVVAELWELGAPPAEGPFTTVANWSAYGTTEINGVQYGQKDVEFARLIDVPTRAGVAVVLAAAGISDEDATRFTAGGWQFAPPGTGATETSYRDFLAASAGEFSAAKHGYVATRSGWISDRTVCYLASGRPAVVQDTGADVPTGKGLITFASADAAVSALQDAQRGHASHSKAARELAHEVFGHRPVLTSLLARAGIDPA